MGFLQIFGRALEWEESKKYHKKIRENAINTIIDWIKSAKEKKCVGKFGYEIEFHKISLDHKNKTGLIDLSGEIDVRNFIEKHEKNLKEEEEFIMQFEFGKWMVEVVPSKPFTFENSNMFVESIEKMYDYIKQELGEKSYLSISVFPLLGGRENYYLENNNLESQENLLNDEEETEINFKSHPYNSRELVENNIFSNSNFTNDHIINPHPRFGCLARNIRTRRGKKVEILVPIYIDEKTNLEKSDDEPFNGQIYMDSMAFGMGNGCFQITIGHGDFNGALYLYDQLLPLTPLLLALTASSPIFKGKLSAFDGRFNIIGMAVDDRSEEERDKNSEKYIYKSRYSPAYSYISENEYVRDFDNDYIKMPIDKEIYETLKKENFSERLAVHISNLLVRDPLVIFDQKINLEEKSDRTHFENFNSTNWNSLRFKPPRLEDNDNCFKVEIRPCELQLTAFENSAVMTLCLIYSRLVMQKDLNFIVPITKVDQNFERAHKMNALETEKFYFRIDGLKNYKKESKLEENNYLTHGNEISKEYFNHELNNKGIKELSMNEIFCGSEEYKFCGLFSLMYDFIEEFIKDEEIKNVSYLHLKFLEKRIQGKILF